MTNESIITGGLRLTKKDRRDFRLGQIIDWPKLAELPESFALSPLTTKNQRQTDKCTAFATCGMSELQEGIELNPYWVFAASKVLSGKPDDWGQDIRTAMKTHIKYGAVEMQEKYPELTENESRYFSKYPEDFKERAQKHLKESFFEVADYPKGWTASDAIKAAIWLFREQKRAVGIGIVWSWLLSEKRIIQWNNNGTGHMVYVYGWDKEGFLLVKNSYGEEAGESGTHHFSPAVIDKAVEKYNAYMFVDMQENEAKKQLWPWWMKLLDFIKKIFR